MTQKTEKTRICFCIPSEYSEILSLLTKFDARIVDANLIPEEFDEFLAWHVDEFVDFIFSSKDKKEADARLVELFDAFGKTDLQMTAVSTSVYDLLSETEVTGILYYREAFDTDIKARTTYDDDCTSVRVREAFKRSGMDADKIERIWNGMIPSYNMEPALNQVAV